MPNWTPADIPDQTGRTAIVTGGYSGIGYVTALELAHHGAHVIVAGRNRKTGRAAVDRIRRQAPDAEVDWAQLDLADLDSVRRFAEEYTQNHDSLDLLINNAGIAQTPPRRTVDGFELTLGTNHFGHFALTGRLLPLLLDRPDARVVTVSSGVHEWPRAKLDLDDLLFERDYKPMTAYARSKLANLLFTQELHRRLAAAGSTVRSLGIDPGPTATNLGPRFPGHQIVRVLLRLAMHSPAVGAAPTLYAATAPDASGGELIKAYRTGPKPHRGAPWAYDEPSARQLWDVSETLTGVSFPIESRQTQNRQT